jgi:hypothetical protein
MWTYNVHRPNELPCAVKVEVHVPFTVPIALLGRMQGAIADGIQLIKILNDIGQIVVHRTLLLDRALVLQRRSGIIAWVLGILVIVEPAVLLLDLVKYSSKLGTLVVRSGRGRLGSLS